MEIIDLEAHFFTQDYVQYLCSRKEAPRLDTVEDEQHQKFERLWFGSGLWASRQATLGPLLDLGEARLREMDAVGIKMHVLTLGGPGCELFEASEGTIMARQINDELSTVVKKYPERFIGLAALAPQDPGGAADELERAVKELGLKGVKINSNIGGEYLTTSHNSSKCDITDNCYLGERSKQTLFKSHILLYYRRLLLQITGQFTQA